MASVQTKEQLLAQEIGRFTEVAVRSLRLPPELEATFEVTTRRARCKRLWVEGLFAIALFAVFVLLDHLITADPRGKAWIVRLGIELPAAILVNLSMLQNPETFWRNAGIAAVCCLICICELSVQSNRSLASSAYAQFSVIAVTLFANAVVRLSFGYALATSTIALSSEVVFLYADRLLSTGGKLVGLYMTACMLLVTLMANYSQNREERLNFLLSTRDEILADNLKEANLQLAHAASQDGLTALSNRAVFDVRLEELWRQMLNEGSVLAIILIDVDHFKRLNDTYGHPYGDKVLQRVARLLEEALRKEDDFVARYGGEEFAVLLPRTPVQFAIAVAERLRGLVELAGLPALTQGTSPATAATISCGVACASPMTCPNVADVIEASDRALYEAKRQGRNAVAASRVFLNTRVPEKCSDGTE